MEKDNLDNKTDDTLAVEVLREIKTQSKRYFVLLVVTVILLIITNFIWIMGWKKYNEHKVQSYDLRGTDYSTVFYNNQGEIDLSENK